MPLIALRGAASVAENESEAILSATEELMHEVLARNHLAAGDLVSCIFTLTEDLDAEFPAVAARRMGLSAVPLLCARGRARLPRRRAEAPAGPARRAVA
jgi:chorismate mutase